MNTAQKISSLLHDDGQRWTSDAGAHLNDLARDAGGSRTYRDGYGTDTYRWNFPDGSAIVVAGDAWDLALDASEPDCYCWEGAGEHGDRCPLSATA